jgi:YidC/Oxa1 family membrane protein insertase
MDFRRTLIAVALSIVVLLGWTWFFSPQQPQTPPAPQTAAKPEPAPTTAAPVKAGPTPPPAVKAETPQPAATPQRPAKVIEVQTQLAGYRLTEQGGRLLSVKLNGIRETKDKNSGPKELIKIENP